MSLSESDMIEACDILPMEANPETTTPTPSGELDCTFQENSCGYSIENMEDEFQFYWNRTTGKILEPLDLQGPLTDHKGKEQGTVYIHCV